MEFRVVQLRDEKDRNFVSFDFKQKRNLIFPVIYLNEIILNLRKAEKIIFNVLFEMRNNGMKPNVDQFTKTVAAYEKNKALYQFGLLDPVQHGLFFY